MKVVLVNPPTHNMISTEIPSFVSEERGCNPALGLMYVASSIINSNIKCEVKFIDAQVEQLGYKDLIDPIYSFMPDWVGITATSFTLIDALKVAKIAKGVFAKVVLGGPHVHLYPRETINLPNVDYLVLGEAEKPIVQLLKNPDQPEKVDNLVYKKDGKIIQNPWRGFVKDLDYLPFPARYLTKYRKYTSLLAKRTPVTTMITSRGCPYRCLFCNRPHLGKTFRPRSPENVLEEFKSCYGMGIKEFLIYDDTFGIDRDRVEKICKLLIKENMDIGFDIRTRVDSVDKELLQLLKKAGCERIHYGVEAGTQRVLDVLRKDITLEQAQEAFKITRKAKIDTLAYFIFGNPTETLEEMDKTIEFAKSLKPDFCHFSILTLFPQTPVYNRAIKQGITKDVWKEYSKNPTKDFVPPLWIDRYPREVLIKQLEKAYKSFYTRPTYIVNKMLKIRSREELTRKVKAGLKVLKL